MKKIDLTSATFFLVGLAVAFLMGPSTQSYTIVFPTFSDCQASSTNLVLGQICFSSASSSIDYCAAPQTGGSSSTLCDTAGDWTRYSGGTVATPTLQQVFDASENGSDQVIVNGPAGGFWYIADTAVEGLHVARDSGLDEY